MSACHLNERKCDKTDIVVLNTTIPACPSRIAPHPYSTPTPKTWDIH